MAAFVPIHVRKLPVTPGGAQSPPNIFLLLPSMASYAARRGFYSFAVLLFILSHRRCHLQSVPDLEKKYLAHECLFAIMSSNTSGEPASKAQSTATGACLCRGVTFSLVGEPEACIQCYCTHCQKNAGGPCQIVGSHCGHSKFLTCANSLHVECQVQQKSGRVDLR